MDQPPFAAPVPRRLFGRPDRRTLTAYALLAPTLLVGALVFLYPAVWVVFLSVTDTNLEAAHGGSFVGVTNFVNLPSDAEYVSALGNTFIFTVTTVLGRLVLALPVALLLNAAWLRRLRLAALMRGIVMLPWVVPVVVATIGWQWIYDGSHGVLNYYLVRLGLFGAPIPFLGLPSTVWPAVDVVVIWKEFPLVAIAILAGLQSIPTDVYEASRVDGANSWQTFRSITLPLLRPVLAVLLLMSTIWTFNNFVYIALLTNGGPGYQTEVLATYVYYQAFTTYAMGYAAAVAVSMVIVLIVLGSIYLRVFESGNPT